MKKVLLVLIAAFAIMGSSYAQESHWSDFNLYDYQFNLPVVGFVQVNGDYVTGEGNWESLEIGAFVGGECRGHMFMSYYPDDGDPYPIFELSLYYTNRGEAVTFSLYDHSTGTLYENCTPNMEIVTGEEHVELYFDYDEAVVLDFVEESTSYTRDIIGYGEENNHWYLIASPIGTVNPTEVGMLINEDGYDLYSFDQSQVLEEWQNYKNSNFMLEPGVGYLYANVTDATLEFVGTAYDGEGTIELVYDSECNLPGWNLVGNPYAEDATVDVADYFRMNGEGTELEVGSGTVYAMEGIFVQAAGEGETVTFTAGMGGGAGEIGGEDEFKLDVRVNGNHGGDLARIRFSEGQGLEKLMLNEEHTKLFFPVDGKDYAVAYAEKMGEMPVSFKAESNGAYTLSFARNAEFGYLHLIDNMTGADVDLLATPSYSFDAKTSDYASRFTLVFAMGESDNNFAFYSNGSFIISNEGNATLQMVDATGRILRSESINGCTNLNANVASGVYTLRLINGDNVKVQKVVVR